MRRSSLLLLLALALPACGTTVAGEQAAPVVLATPTATPETGCEGEPLPPRRGGVTGLAADGSPAWTRELPASDSQAPPLHDGERVVLGDWQGLAALDAGTGEPLWQVAAPTPVYGLWRDGDLVVAVGQQVGEGGQAVGVDPATGEVRWRVPLPGGGLLGDQVLTGDGGLAWSLDHEDRRTQVLDLATGQVRWTSATAGTIGQPAAGGGLVLRPEAGAVTAYDSRSGEVRWRSDRVGDMVRVQVVGDLALVDDTGTGLGLTGDVVALRLSDGTRAWTLDEDETLAVGGVGPAGVVTHTTSSGRPTFGLVDVATGQVRWRAETQIALHLPALVTEDAVITVEGGTSLQQDTSLVARRAADGHELWRVDASGTTQPPVSPAPGQVLVTESGGAPLSATTAVTRDLRTGRELGRAEVRGYPSRLGHVSVLQGDDPGRGCTGSSWGRGPATPEQPAPAAPQG